MPSNSPFRWGALIAFMLGRLFVITGFAAWGFILYQIYDVVASAMAAPGFRDGGSNNLGAGIGWAILIGLVLLGALVAFFGALIVKGGTQDPEDIRVLRFAALINGSLLGFSAVAIFLVSIFAQ